MRRAPNGLAAIGAILRHVAVTTKHVSEEEIQDTLQLLAASKEVEMETPADQLEEKFKEYGIRHVLLRLLRRRFGDLPESVVHAHVALSFQVS